MRRTVAIPTEEVPSFLRTEMEITVGEGCGIAFRFRKKRNEDIYIECEMTLDDFAEALEALGISALDLTGD